MEPILSFLVNSRPAAMGTGKCGSTFDIRGFSDFQARARDDALSPYEKVGFPDEYRAGKAPLIVSDIVSKLKGRDRSVLDIGPGCSDLPVTFMRYCETRGHTIVLVDSIEMLDQLPNPPLGRKIAGAFPDCFDQIEAIGRKFDAILVYSVVQYVFTEGNLWQFVDCLSSLLADGGQILLDDVPNSSRRKRFISSASGQQYHKRHFPGELPPSAEFNQLEIGYSLVLQSLKTH
jgi:hypothetical protein